MLIPDRILRDIKSRADIVTVVRACGVSLQQKGRGIFYGLCPFHDDHHPSFQVDPRKQLFHCWPCNLHGDAFQFVKLRDRCDFPTAVKTVASICNLSHLLPEDHP